MFTVHLCRAAKAVTVLPNEFLSLPMSENKLFDDKIVALEPRATSKTYLSTSWPPAQLVSVVDNEIRIVNKTLNPIHIPKNEHICQVRSTYVVDPPKISSTSQYKKTCSAMNPPYSKSISLDKQLSQEWCDIFNEANLSFDSVFEPFGGRYNGKSGRLKMKINFGSSTPPVRKLHAPNYGRDNLNALQEKFDELEAQGVFARPEDVGVIVEHVSPSFLVRKTSGGFRLVTAFTALAEYTKTLPTVMPTVETMLRTISEWKFIIMTDLTDAFYQIPLSKESMKWCATSTPFRGLRVYLVACQGLPGSSEWLEELLCLLFGEMVQRGVLGKVADDLYVGGQTLRQLCDNWIEVLRTLLKNGLKLKGVKTFIAPTRAQLLGWDWCNGTIAASSHKLLPLIKCAAPATVTAVRSYIGAYKVFNRVVRGCAMYLDKLEKMIAGKQKNDKIAWSDELLESFSASQEALKSVSVITLPTRNDHITIVHDGSQVGIGSVLYLKRGDSIKVGGYFSAKLKQHQVRWYPCEIEALSIAVSVTHFGPYIRQSLHCTQILTDNRPCVQAWDKMRRGEFSTSARVATFMSTLSEFNVEVQHISGNYNLPSDFLSRNPLACDSHNCQVCKFVDESDLIVVRNVSVKEILAGQASVPYGTPPAWKSLQSECPDLRRVHAHLSNGTRPTAKNSKVGVVKRFLRNVKIGRGGLLVVKQSQPFLPQSELIVVPLHILHGLVTSLHLTLNHPTAHQLTNVFNRCYYSLNVSDCVANVTDACSQCQALKTLPTELHHQSSSIPPTSPLYVFAADVLRRSKQFIFVVRDTFSSYTYANIIDNEQKDTLRSSLIVSISSLRPNPQSSATVRIDNAPGLSALINDVYLAKHNISLDDGRVHNKNKNPVIDKGIKELGSELLKMYPEGGPVTASQLAIVVNQLNSRIRNRGLSAWEILCQRDQFTGEQIDVNDLSLSEQQAQHRAANQSASAKCKARGNPSAEKAVVQTGSLVHVKSEGDKNTVRYRYIVVEMGDEHCILQRFVKSQLRSKRYSVKLNEIYPVIPDPIVIPGKIRGLDDSDESEEESPVSRNERSVRFGPDQVRTIPHRLDDCSAGVEDSRPLFERVEDCPAIDCYDQNPGPSVVVASPSVDADVDTPHGRSNADPPPEAVVPSDNPGARGESSHGLRRSSRAASKPKWMVDYV